MDGLLASGDFPMCTYLCGCISEAIQMRGTVPHPLCRVKCTNFSCASKIFAMIFFGIFITRPLHYTITRQECSARPFYNSHQHRWLGAWASNGTVSHISLCSHIPKHKCAWCSSSRSQSDWSIISTPISIIVCQILIGMCLSTSENIPNG